MFFVLLLVAGAYFFLISILRGAHTEMLKGYEEKVFNSSLVKIISLIFEVLNKISLALFATLTAYSIIKNIVLDFNNWNVEFLIWIALIHLVPTTFFYGLLEIIVLKYNVKKQDIE